MPLFKAKTPAWKQKLAWCFSKQEAKNLKKKTKLAWHMKSLNSNSVGDTQCLVVYILEFELLWLPINKLDKFTISKSSLF